MRFVLSPAAAKSLSDQDHQTLRAAVIQNWKKFVHGGIAVFLLTGFFNYFRVIMDGSHKKDGLYHGLIGTKIILAFVIFFISSALVGRSAGMEKLRQNSRFWMGVNIALAVIIIAISGYLRLRPYSPPGIVE